MAPVNQWATTSSRADRGPERTPSNRCSGRSVLGPMAQTGRVERAALEASWERSRAHLRRAFAALGADGDGVARAEAQDLLASNELGLCADALAAAAAEVDGPALWAALAAAALEMGLHDRALAWVARTGRYPCPCCGRLVFDEPPGSYAICPVCFWEDDPVQLRWPDFGGGANRPSLREAQAGYLASGAIEPGFADSVRAAAEDESFEPEWRTLDTSVDDVEVWDADRAPWPTDLTVLYWWRPTFWRRAAPPL